jgi:hypothetical protein
MRRLKPQWTVIWPVTFPEGMRVPHQCILYKTPSVCATGLGQSPSARRLGALKEAYSSVGATEIIVHAVTGGPHHTSASALYLPMGTRKRNR